MSDAIRVLSAGAAESLIGLISTRFTAETGFRIDASFAGVGVVMKRLEKSEHADVVVLTQPAIAELEARGLIAGACVATIGAVAMPPLRSIVFSSRPVGTPLGLVR